MVIVLCHSRHCFVWPIQSQQLEDVIAGLEARWAAYFDRRGIAWEYEPARFDGWTPDFRLVLNGVEAYAEVKPVSEFPMDVAQRVLNASCDADVLILGQGPRHAWRYRGDGWNPMDLTKNHGTNQSNPS